ncbi:carboxymuconolactone decarboxylase family protein [Actinomadura meridiana]|uniref:Carboxymuconolactone decarboxylase family protein n=1 Tax=Actinomadura meridiana TaxID=559626 RepID=A0ABP8C9X7_9ACTN
MTPTTDDAGWPRLALPPRERMTAWQSAIYDSSVAKFGGAYGPRLPLVLAPELYRAWAEMSERLSDADLPARLRELAILVTARFWDADFIWFAHAGPAADAGLDPGTIDRIRAGGPVVGAADEQAIEGFVTELLHRHRVGEAVHARAVETLGARGLVELTALVGHYTSVALMLAAHAAPMPVGVDRPLSVPPAVPTEEEQS